MLISFGWTAQYLPPNGTKDTTRRVWSDRTFNSWVKAWDQEIYTHAATDKNLAYGGKYIGSIRLKQRPYMEQLRHMPPSDLTREGGMVGSVQEFIDKYFEGNSDKFVAVVRFYYHPMDCDLVRDYVKTQQKVERQKNKGESLGIHFDFPVPSIAFKVDHAVE